MRMESEIFGWLPVFLFLELFWLGFLFPVFRLQVERVLLLLGSVVWRLLLLLVSFV